MKAYSYKPIFQKTTLSNGVRVVTESHPFTRAANVGIFVEVGSRDEPAGRAGLTHFLEHLVFKGTRKRSSLDIAKVLDAVGGDLNAYTTREYTCFHATTLKEHMPLSVDVLSDLVTSATLAREDFLKEREVILQEIQMSKDNLEEYILDLFLDLSYHGQALGIPILGTEDTLAKLKRADLANHYNSFFRGPRIIVSAAGPVEHEHVVDIVAKKLGRVQKRSRALTRRGTRVRRVMEYIPRNSEQVHLLVGFPSNPFRSKARFDALVVNEMLGGGVTSRLYQRIREDQGLVYSVYSFLQSFLDSGLFMVYAGTSDKNAMKVLKTIRAELAKVFKGQFSDREVEMYKTQLKGQILLGAEDMENRMNSLGVNEMIFGDYRPVDEIIRDIEKVSRKSIRDFVQKYFSLKEASLMVMGDLQPAEALRLMNLWE
ncbi:MAG: M16 family metallopeptidase [Bdellovibrionales bacterium]